MHKTVEQVAAEEKQRALDMNFPDPDFDFREYYTKGDIVYYAYINDMIGEKEVIKLKLRTIYARTMIGFEELGCHTIGVNTRDRIFANKSEAEAFLKTVNVVAKYG